MNNAVITPCSHFFHAGCLKKWLYVQETCPLCHSQLKSQSSTTGVPNQDTPPANQSPAGQEVATPTEKQKDDRNEDGAVAQESHVMSGESLSTASSSSPPSPSSPVTDSPQIQSHTDPLWSSISPSSATADMLSSPRPFLHPSTSSVSHQSVSKQLINAETPPVEPEPSAVSLLDAQESSARSSSQPDQAAPPPEEQSTLP